MDDRTEKVVLMLGQQLQEKALPKDQGKSTSVFWVKNDVTEELVCGNREHFFLPDG